MKNRLLSTILTCILLAITLIVPQQAQAENVHAMTAEELEVYISYLQIVLQNKRKEAGIVETPSEVPATTPEAQETMDVTFNGKVYTGAYQGEQQDGKPHGTGTFEGYYQKNKLVYTGQWLKGEMSGEGKVEADAYTLHFDITEGVYDKTGSYVGDVVNGLPEGTGTFSTVNSKNVPWQYTGEWKNGAFNGQGTQSWEGDKYTSKVGTFTNNDFTPTASEAFAYTARSKDYSISNKAKNALQKMTNCFTGKQKKGASPSYSLTDYIDLNQYKKRPSDYGDKLIYVSHADVFQVLTWEIGNKTVEQILMETNDDTIYYGFYYGKSNITEGMHVSGYVLPMDWDTYESVDKRNIWAVFCAVSDFIEESYETLRRGDNNEDVWNMKVRMQELGYFSANAGLSYSYNATCEQRVRQFQEANGLPVTGVADHDTLKLLYSNKAKYKP